jgi:hypothetical protein
MADKLTQVLLDGLSRAAAEPAGRPLHGGKGAPGLFAATASGRQAAQRGKDEGYLRVVRTEAQGKAPVEVCSITEKGLAYLLGQVSPRPVLEDFVRALEARQAQAAELLAVARQMQEGLGALASAAARVLEQLYRPAGGPTAEPPSANGSDAWPATALSYLAGRQESGSAEDCPLPELFRHVQPAAPGLTVGRFHDGLRALHQQARIYLHPWTGPLCDMPEPAYALLVGHEVAYYASVRK